MTHHWPLVGATLLVTLFLLFAYRALWRRVVADGRTPTGFGVFAAPAMLIAATTGGTSGQLVTALVVTTIGTFIYWFDDAMGMKARIRVAISFVTGMAIGAAFLLEAGFDAVAVVGLSLLAGIVHVALVNTINFQDGADLNLGTFILLTAGLLLLFAPVDPDWAPVALACLAFTLPFAAMNSRPRTIYFGDSGSFAFAALFTILGAAFVSGRMVPPPEAAIPTALPVVDMAFVTALRIRIRQPFTTRHYFHLYQRLQKSQRGFFYLLPQFVSCVLCLVVAQLLQFMGSGRTLSVALSMAAVSIPVFLVFRRCFAAGEPGPPHAREARA